MYLSRAQSSKTLCIFTVAPHALTIDARDVTSEDRIHFLPQELSVMAVLLRTGYAQFDACEAAL